MGIDFSAEKYVDDVLSGEQVACRWVQLACERHRRDLETGHERGLWFDEPAARMAVAFFTVLHHWKGEWAGTPVMLEPWQQFVVWSLFGWKRADGFRRFRTGYLEVARKNGKTTMAAGIGLYLAFVEGEPGAEVYTAATKKDQARISHKDATEMVKRSPHLRREIQTFRDNLHSQKTGSKMEPLGRDADSTDGLNIHGAIVDEVHAWKDRDLWDKLETATGSRRQPLMFAITTAGYDRHSLCFQLHRYGEQVLEGVIEDDSYFALIYGIDEDDNWEDEGVWIKANPNLGVSKKWDDMRRLAVRAAEMPAALNAFLRLHLNVWTEASERWVSPQAWARCGETAVDPKQLVERLAYGGLDLSTNIDITAWVLVFPPQKENEPYYVVPHFWIPEENVAERVKRDRVPYDVWIRQGYLNATPGNAIDFEFILHQIGTDAQQYEIAEAAFDRWGATAVYQRLMEMGGDEWPVQFGQGFASMNPAMREMEKLILSGKLAHGNHPVLNWMASNLVVRLDPAGNMKPDKEKSTEKIDGMVALAMALDRAVRQGGIRKSVYRDRGLRTL